MFLFVWARKSFCALAQNRRGLRSTRRTRQHKLLDAWQRHPQIYASGPVGKPRPGGTWQHMCYISFADWSLPVRTLQKLVHQPWMVTVMDTFAFLPLWTGHTFHLEREKKRTKQTLAYSALLLSYVGFGSLFDTSCMFVSVCACVCTWSIICLVGISQAFMNSVA